MIAMLENKDSDSSEEDQLDYKRKPSDDACLLNVDDTDFDFDFDKTRERMMTYSATLEMIKKINEG